MQRACTKKLLTCLPCLCVCLCSLILARQIYSQVRPVGPELQRGFILCVKVSLRFAKEGSAQITKDSKFKLIDLDVNMIINPDDCQKRQVSLVRTGPRRNCVGFHWCNWAGLSGGIGSHGSGASHKPRPDSGNMGISKLSASQANSAFICLG